MKLAIFFRRSRTRRPAVRRQPDQLMRDWTVRDWADLPPHHPRQD